MKRSTVRRLYKLSFLPNLVLLGLIIWDYAENRGDWMGGLLVAYTILLLALVALLVAAVPDDELGEAPPDDGADSTSYGKETP
ncbi:MAG: hypothetical protein ACPGQL_10130 [Thermoplasmatota archaeon]